MANDPVLQSLWKVVAYDKLLRKIGSISDRDVLFAGEIRNVDAAYDDMIASVIKVIPLYSAHIADQDAKLAAVTKERDALRNLLKEAYEEMSLARPYLTSSDQMYQVGAMMFDDAIAAIIPMLRSQSHD